MLVNNFRFIRRRVFRKKSFALVNLLGLTIGLTSFILIALWINSELTYDKFHKGYDDIYQIMANRGFDNRVFTDNNMPFPLVETLERDFPQVENAVKVASDYERVLSYKDTRISMIGCIVSKHYFDIFSWIFIEGISSEALLDPTSIVITKATAKALFGQEDPINKIIKLNNAKPYRVSAVVADAPDNSSIKFDFVIGFDYQKSGLKRALYNWDNAGTNTYVLLKEKSNIPQFNQKLNSLMRFHIPQDTFSVYFSFPMSNWRLFSDFKEGKNAGGMIENVRLFGGVAFIILLIACVNFVNLSTARSEKRAREVGIRKTLGSTKYKLVLKFLNESVLLIITAFFFSMILVLLLLPAFEQMVGKNISLTGVQPLFWIILILIVLITGIISGSYPAFYFSSFNPARVLRGSYFEGKSVILPRRIFMVSQFAISIFLLAGTIIIFKQLQFIKKRDLGYNPANLIMLPSSNDVDNNFLTLKEDLYKTGMVNAITRTSDPITGIYNRSDPPDWEGKPIGLNLVFAILKSDVGFSRTTGARILMGRDFLGIPSDSNAVLLNKSAIDAMKLKNPIGQLLRYGQKTLLVVGVIDNMVMESPYKSVDPMMIFYLTKWSNSISVRLQPGVSIQRALTTVQNIYKEIDPGLLFQYHFVDREFGQKYQTEELIGKISVIFAILASFICCISLYGLTSFTIEKRFKEIGIRKVMGSTTSQILILILNEFLKLLLIALLIAIPFTWLAIDNWLKRYQFHVNLNFWLFITDGTVIFILTFLVVSLNTIKVAIRNPVTFLKAEI
jgi:putative ABC transport system permease protein